MEIKSLENGVMINGKVFKDGQIVKLKLKNKKGRTYYIKGKIKFKIYEDGEGYYDYSHMGWVILSKKKIYFPLEHKYGYTEDRCTLIDWIDKIVK